jgi:hypothetical protein
MSLLCLVLGERDFSRRPEVVVHRDSPTRGRSARDFRYAFAYVVRGPLEHCVGHVRSRLDTLLDTLLDALMDAVLNSLMEEVGQSHQQLQIHGKRLP